jgi:hypothetical protein
MLNSKTFVTTAVILPLVLSILSSPVFAAGSSQTISRLHGNAAVAFWPGPVGQFSNIFLGVDKTSAGTDVQLFADTPTGGFALGELSTSANVFQITPLNSATLSPVTFSVSVFDEFGNLIQTLPVTIQAAWTGFGTLRVTAGAIVGVGSGGHFVFTGPETIRQATATGSLNLGNGAQQLGQTTSAQLVKFTNLFISGSK